MANLASEAIIVGEDWISEHYLTTDARSQSFQARVLERRKAWDEEDADGGESVRTKFLARRAGLVAELAAISPDADLSPENAKVDVEAARALAARIRSTLGFVGGLDTILRRGPVEFVSLQGLNGAAPLVLIDAIPVAQVEDLLEKDEPTLLEPFTAEDGDSHEETSAMRLLSRLFADDEHPKFALVLAGRWVLVAERERWFEGRYLAIDLQLVCERNDAKRGGEIDRALACVDAASLAPDADGDIWWTGTLEDSIKHTVGVSQDLREGVRESIELIANEVVARRLSQGLEALPASKAQTLAKQSLRFLYRILFLLYAEASPQLKVLPVGAAEYENGYSLDRLRELTLVELASDAAQHGTHFYDSLAVLFRMVDQGHTPAEVPMGWGEGLQFESLRADLFTPAAVSLIAEVKLGDAALQAVLSRLLLSKESKGRDRGYISYADLGINQLGAVYEGLMSYTGFFAETALYEVAPEGDPAKGSWVVPTDRDTGIEAKHYVKRTNETTGAPARVVHAEGSFVFRLAGRERQQSASYYTPEVLTQFTVSQALEELLDQDGVTTTAADILTLTICEPALGSGAFAIEAVRQLGAQYLKRRQDELGTRIDPDEYPAELQKVKASIALHQVYGVDLNATAVEFAEITLWLDTMSEGLRAPWFGLHLKRGNSLIGARRATYSRSDVNSKAWLKQVPRDAPLFDRDGEGRLRTGVDGAIHHFLLPADGWGSAVDAKEAKELAPDALAALKAWRRGILAKPSKQQLDSLVSLSYRVERLWDLAQRRLEIAEHEIRREIPVWGLDSAEPPIPHSVTREEIEARIGDPDSAYQRLRLVMDAWCALWFWPLIEGATGGALPPTLDQWIATLRLILGEHTNVRPAAARYGQTTLGSARSGWEALNDEEQDDLEFASVSPVAVVVSEYPWLGVVRSVAAQQGFFHWELDFATVFASGGFDLQVGNPPWVRPRSDVDALLAEGDPWWMLAVKPTQDVLRRKQAATLAVPGMRDIVLEGTTEMNAVSSFLGSQPNFPDLAGLQPDLYRCFMAVVWMRASARGISALIHLESHFTDEKAGRFRAQVYSRLRRHWQFANELHLFEIQNQKIYGINVYAKAQGPVNFLNALGLYHPTTVSRSLTHDGSGPEPGYKTVQGDWDTAPHRSRIERVSYDVLKTWHSILEEDSSPVAESRMVYSLNKATSRVLRKISAANRLSRLSLRFSSGWHENSDRKRGLFDVSWGRVSTWNEAILQGPHIFLQNPFYKSPNSTMLHHRDWASVDLEALAKDELPTTVYKPTGDGAVYNARDTTWPDIQLSSRDVFRLAWRSMAANSGERTFVSAVIPPGAAHVHGVTSMFVVEGGKLSTVAGIANSLISDFLVRVSPKSTISATTVGRLALGNQKYHEQIAFRSLRLSAVTEVFSPLWTKELPSVTVEWTGGIDYSGRPRLEDAGSKWTPDSLLRRAADRRQALLEIDVLVGLSLNLTAEELCTIYRTQFPVLFGYDQDAYYYDANGRLVPSDVVAVWRSSPDSLTKEERTATNASGNTYVYELPFVTLDREADMRQAYAHFGRVLAERS